jgi:hypothetical protein
VAKLITLLADDGLIPAKLARELVTLLSRSPKRDLNHPMTVDPIPLIELPLKRPVMFPRILLPEAFLTMSKIPEAPVVDD